MSSRGGASSSSDVVKETVGSGIAEGVGSDCEGRQIELLEVYQHLKASSTPAKFLQDENSSKVIPSFSTVVLNRKNFGADGPDEKKSVTPVEESINFSFNWTLISHARLLFAIFDYATKKASPKKLMKLMGFIPETLTSEHVKSHLQKFRVHYKKTRDPEYEKLKDAVRHSEKNDDKVTPADVLRKIVHTYPVQNFVMDYFRTAKQAEQQKSNKIKARPRHKGRKRSFSEFDLCEPADDEENSEFLPKMMLKHRKTMKLHEHNRLRYSYKTAEQFGEGDDCLENVNDVIGALTRLTPKHAPQPSSTDAAEGIDEISDQILEDIIFRHMEPATNELS